MRKPGALLFFLFWTSLCFSQSKKLKVFISVDMEGIAGVVTGDQLGPGSFEYERFRGFMTQEAITAVSAATRAGATEIVVADGHGNGENLLIEQFPASVRIVRSWPRHLGMMGGLDSSFDAALFVGYHASTHNPNGVRAHTFSSARLTRVAVNGKDVTEGAWNAAIAGELGVPVIFVSGDDAAVAEIRDLIGRVDAVETKQSLGFHSANTLTPEAARAKISAAVESSVKHLAECKPYRVATPVTVDLSFKNPTVAETAAYLHLFERIDSHSIRFRAKDMAEAADTFQFLEHYRIDLAP